MAPLRRKLYECACRYCGKLYETANRRRLYCCTRCRRDFQNEERKARRAAEAEREFVYKSTPWDNDPWEREDNIEAIYANTLADGWTGTPCGLTMCPDEAVGGALACQQCQKYGHGQPSLYGDAFGRMGTSAPGDADTQADISEDAASTSADDISMPMQTYTHQDKQGRTRKPPRCGADAARARRRYRKRNEARAKLEKTPRKKVG